MAHATRPDTTPDPEVQGYVAGGYWYVVCLDCGWEMEGRYPAGREADGLAMASLRGDLHEMTEKLKEEVARRG
jgi:hypothetical protein